MPDQVRRLARLGDLALGEVGQLLHQVRPVVGDGVALVVAELVHRLDGEAARAQVLEQHAVGGGGEAVGVGKNDEGQGS